MTPTPLSPEIFVVEDDGDLAQSLQNMFALEGWPSVVFPSAEAFIDSLPVDRCGCVVLDVRLPGMSGLDLQSTLLALGIRLPTIVMTGQATVSDTIRAFQNGAFNVMEKPCEPLEFAESVRQAIAADLERQTAVDRQRRQLRELTEREREVLELLVQDHPTKQIARKLGLSSSTVEKHRAKIFTKVGVSSVVALTRIYLASGHDKIAGPHLRFKKPGTAPRRPDLSSIRTSSTPVQAPTAQILPHQQ
ncbi:MAG: response regulator [Pirellulaceae bacterium]|nr:response regulator [Pirellulaceae bacterium]